MLIRPVTFLGLLHHIRRDNLQQQSLNILFCVVRSCPLIFCSFHIHVQSTEKAEYWTTLLF